MRKLLAAGVCLALLGCSTAVRRPEPHTETTALPLAGSLPTLAELDRLAPRAASGTLTGPERIIKARGDQLAVWYPSRGATADAVSFSTQLVGSTSEVNFALYTLANFAFADPDTLMEINVEGTYGGALDDPAEGLFLAFADHGSGRWIFHQVDRLSSWMDVSDLAFAGRGGGNHSYVAVINFSAHPLELRDLYLRFAKPGEVVDDEWLYFTQAVDPLAGSPGEITSVARVRHDGSEHEVLLPGSDTAPVVSYRDATVTNTPAGMRLRYTRAVPGSPTQGWDSALDGSGGAVYADHPTQDVRAGGSSPDGNVTVWTQFQGIEPGVSVEHYRLHVRNETTLESGPMSFLHADVSDPVWDRRIDNADYRLLASLGTPGSRYIVHFWDDATAIDERSPGQFYTASPTEVDSYAPTLLRVVRSVDFFHFDYIIFSSLGRDGGARYAMHAYAPTAIPGGSDNTQRWINDAGADVLACAASPDGTKLAFVKRPVGSPLGTLYVRQTFEADAPLIPVADNVDGRISWYDPAP